MMDALPTVPCPSCDGQGSSEVLACPGGRWLTLVCKRCGATGRVDSAEAERVAEGKRRMADRRQRGLSLRDEAARLGMTAEALSDIEHARPYLPPPNRHEPPARRES